MISYKLTNEAKRLLDPIVPALRQFYQIINGDTLGLVELSVEFERQFGHQIADLVCRQVKVTQAACMVLAIAQVRPISDTTIDEASRICHEEVKILKAQRELPELRT